ncbi:MAG: DUF1501 domain-containing protein [Betaproteobacteria bacterium]|nr:DUF1501 domain-containing protein [Betaproteobacteria bacterium]
MSNRRQFLTRAGLLSLAGIAASFPETRALQLVDYKALVVVFLSGGYDGNNVLLPVDAAYGDYSKARTALALPKDSLVSLSGTHMGHKFALSPGMRAMAGLFEQKRMAVVANVGARTAKLPPFMGSHAEQQQWVQGWMGDADQTGWGGRMVDLLPQSLTARQPLVAMGGNYTSVLPNNASLSFANSNSNANWGRVNLLNATDPAANRVEWASRLQSGNAYEAEFVRSMKTSYSDSIDFALGQKNGPTPTGVFPDKQIGRDLKFLAKHIPYSKQAGAMRQVFLVEDGGYDTHTEQLSSTVGLDARLKDVADSIGAFDTSMQALGMGSEVLTIVISEFGRTLDPAAGVGSDHAWGSHWFAVGGAVKGGLVYGQNFPSLVNGGVDDSSDSKRGYWVPQFSSDQFIADIGLWMGLSAAQVTVAMPNLANFKAPTVGYL